ncbi:MAG TPA: DUF4926 domain-containing protein [Candidatus Kapabacteria bacterium]|jgi:hypothetical protein|nr:DUF4926 domain-containing protein [Candidatus Kapabacteria bacterium]
MKHELYSEVALAVDIPEHRLKKGDIATVVDYLPAGTNPEPGLALEIFNVLGESIDILMVAESEVESLNPHEISHVRVLNEAL